MSYIIKVLVGEGNGHPPHTGQICGALRDRHISVINRGPWRFSVRSDRSKDTSADYERYECFDVMSRGQ